LRQRRYRFDKVSQWLIGTFGNELRISAHQKK